MDERKRKRFIGLAWWLLEAKYIYYCTPKGVKCPSDGEYDKYEAEYKELAKTLNLEPTASDMVGFDESKPSCRLVKEYIDSNKKMSKNIFISNNLTYRKKDAKINKEVEKILNLIGRRV